METFVLCMDGQARSLVGLTGGAQCSATYYDYYL